MRVRRQRSWADPRRAITDEAVMLNRRQVLAGAAAAGLLVGSRRQAQAAPDPRFPPGRAITPEIDATTYNNYYEFSEGKRLASIAAGFPMSPWTIRVEGMVKQPRTIAIEDLLKQVSPEERVYRHRCVEAWAMTVPWTGFQMSELLRIFEPTSAAKYVVFETISDPKHMPGEREPLYPWPYIEAVTVAEAANELAFVATGLYGRNLLPQNGGPIRIVLPWKYGFKSGKAFVKITFTDKRPVTFWEAILPSEYGFWANVNPAVAHPRWSQAQERLLGSNEMVPTQIYNGYGDIVASLYTDLKSEKLYM
jgi:sulfoxide reductase catalytic subunit YedY